MASITEKRGRDGDIISYRFRACVGRDASDRQIWRTATVKRPEGFTPARERKEVERLADDWEREQRAAFRAAGASLDSAYIFCSDYDATRPICPTAPTKWTARFIARHNLPDVSPHDLRHSAASLALEAGASLKEIQELLGHADASTTLKFYAGVTEERKRKAVDGIERLLAGTN